MRDLIDTDIFEVYTKKRGLSEDDPKISNRLGHVLEAKMGLLHIV